MAQKTPSAIAIVGSRMIPFQEPVLPVGYAFALIDENGDVQVHSQSTRDKQENLFRELDNPNILRASVGARTPMTLDVAYSGRDYRMYVRPLNGTPWSLVVFRDKQLLRSANFDLANAWAISAMMFIGVVLLPLLVILVCDALYTANWIWPCRYGGYIRSYWRAAVQTLILAGFACWALHRPETVLTHFGGIVIFPAVAVALLCLNLAERRTLEPWEWLISLLVSTLGSLVLVVLFAVNSDWTALAAFIILMALIAKLNLLEPWRPPYAVPHIDDIPLSKPDRDTETAFRFAYVAMMFSVLVAVAVLPSVVLFDDAAAMERTNLARMAQVRWVDSLQRRAKRLRETKSGAPLRERLNRLDDRYALTGFPLPIQFGEPNARQPENPERGLLIPRLMSLISSPLPEVAPLMPYAAELRTMTSSVSLHSELAYRWDESGVLNVNDDAARALLCAPEDPAQEKDDLKCPEAWRDVDPPRSIDSPSSTETVGTPNSGWIGFALGLAPILLLLIFIIFAGLWAVARKLFLLDADLVSDDSNNPLPADVTGQAQLALWQVLHNGFLSPGAFEIARYLFQRGALRRNPGFCVNNAQYQQIGEPTNDEMLLLQRETNRPSGLGLRQLLPIGAALGAIIFFLTQPELFSWALAVVAAVSAALPKLLGVFSHFGSSPEKH